MRRFSIAVTRRDFLQAGGFLAVAALLRPTGALAMARPIKHPDPRPGITSANVLPDDKLPKKTSVREAYAAARAHPEIFDGLACGCGCTGEHRSLLVCYETEQPTGCWACRDETKLVGDAIAKGKTLAEIRKIIDEKYG
jgi:hypothetical protein